MSVSELSDLLKKAFYSGGSSDYESFMAAVCESFNYKASIIAVEEDNLRRRSVTRYKYGHLDYTYASTYERLKDKDVHLGAALQMPSGRFHAKSDLEDFLFSNSKDVDLLQQDICNINKFRKDGELINGMVAWIRLAGNFHIRITFISNTETLVVPNDLQLLLKGMEESFGEAIKSSTDVFNMPHYMRVIKYRQILMDTFDLPYEQATMLLLSAFEVSNQGAMSLLCLKNETAIRKQLREARLKIGGIVHEQFQNSRALDEYIRNNITEWISCAA